MKQLKKVYLISKVGPEWNEPIEVCFRSRFAHQLAKTHERKIGNGIIDQLSAIIVTPVKIRYED